VLKSIRSPIKAANVDEKADSPCKSLQYKQKRRAFDPAFPTHSTNENLNSIQQPTRTTVNT